MPGSFHEPHTLEARANPHTCAGLNNVLATSDALHQGLKTAGQESHPWEPQTCGKWQDCT